MRRKKGRIDSGLYFAEGMRMVQEALLDAEAEIQFIIVSDEFAEKNKIFINSLDEKGKTVYTARESLFLEICNTESPQGIGVVLRMPEFVVPDWEKQTFVLILDGIADPGNLGTIIRTAEAAGVSCVCLLKGCTDLYNPKTVRSTMGSLFRMHCLSGGQVEALLPALKQHGFTIAVTALKHSVSLEQAEIVGPRALVIGSEAFGVSDEVLNYADIRVKISMEGKVESLNAAVAAGIAMYFLRPQGGRDRG
nr:RNA methyltransferase [Ructibacterium gallinarum]